MQRRLFLQSAGLAGLTLTALPHLAFGKDFEYSILELMGKADVKMFGEGYQLRREVNDAFMVMKKEAYSAGIDLKVVSAFRSFDRQRSIFEGKFDRYTNDEGLEPIAAIDKIIQYSTIPGTSRHHWGTDIDIVDGYRKVKGDVLVPSKFEEGGPYADFKKWMDENAKAHGFHLVYTNTPGRRGFKYEPWHYSYAPISRPMLAEFRRKNITRLLQTEDFEGSEHFTEGFLTNYIQDNILDINTELL